MGKIIEFENIKKELENIKEAGKKVVLTNGCFDILHVGHARYLKEAKKLGDILVIGVNSDKSVKILKGEGRPINNESDRAEILSYLEFIDFVVIFNEKTADNLILQVNPNIYVKGGDYSKESLPEFDTLNKVSCDITFINFVNGYSTTETIKKINQF